jgi:predicted esterase
MENKITTMPMLNFYHLANQIFNSYQNEDYDKALELSLKAHENFTKHHNLTGYWITKAYSRLGEKDKALDYLREWSEEGYWIKPNRLENDQDLKTIRETDDFNRIKEISKKRYEKAKSKAKAKYEVITPDNYSIFEEYPFILAIHWRASTMDEFARYYKSTVNSKGLILGSVQSSQPCGVNQFCWDDYEKARAEIKDDFHKINNEYRIDKNKIILSGASQGGRLSIEIALKRLINVKGFISVIPYLPEIKEYKHALEDMSNKISSLKGVIITGDKDISYNTTTKLKEEMEKAGLQSKLDVIEGMGHTIPKDFPKRIKDAIDFIYSEG